MRRYASILVLAVLIGSPMSVCAATISRNHYGTLANGQQVDRYTLATADAKMSVDVINYGGIITSLKVPDRHGERANILLGYQKSQRVRS